MQAGGHRFDSDILHQSDTGGSRETSSLQQQMIVLNAAECGSSTGFATRTRTRFFGGPLQGVAGTIAIMELAENKFFDILGKQVVKREERI